MSQRNTDLAQPVEPSCVAKHTDLQPASPAEPKPAAPPATTSGFPNLSLDAPDDHVDEGPAEPASAVFAAEVVEDQDAAPLSSTSAVVAEVVEDDDAAPLAQPASAVLAAEIVDDQDLAPLSSSSAVVAEFVGEQRTAKPVSEVHPASDVFVAEFAEQPPVPAEDEVPVLEAKAASDSSVEVSSDVVPAGNARPGGAETPSGVVEDVAIVEAEDVVMDEDAPIISEAASAIFVAPPTNITPAEVLDQNVLGEAEAIVAESVPAAAKTEPVSGDAAVEATDQTALVEEEAIIAEPAPPAADVEPMPTAVMTPIADESVFGEEGAIVAESTPIPAEAQAAFANAAAAVTDRAGTDEGEAVVAEPVSDVGEAEPVSAVVAAEVTDEAGVGEVEAIVAEPVPDVAPAAPASAVVAALVTDEAEPAPAAEAVLGGDEVVAAEPASVVAEAEPASVVAEVEEVAEAVLDEDEVAAAEPASVVAEAEPASAVAEAEEVSEAVLDEDEVVAAEPASVVAEAEPASVVAEAEEVSEAVLDEDEVVAAEPASVVAEAEPASVVAEAEEVAEAVLDEDEVVAAEPASVVAEAEPASVVAEAEEVAEAVLDEDEFVAAEPASVVAEAEPASVVAEAEEVSEAVLDEDEFVAAEAEEVTELEPEIMIPKAPVKPPVKKAKGKGKIEEEVVAAEEEEVTELEPEPLVPKAPAKPPARKGKGQDFKPAGKKKAGDSAVEWDGDRDELDEEADTEFAVDEEAAADITRAGDETIAYEPLDEEEDEAPAPRKRGKRFAGADQDRVDLEDESAGADVDIIEAAEDEETEIIGDDAEPAPGKKGKRGPAGKVRQANLVWVDDDEVVDDDYTVPAGGTDGAAPGLVWVDDGSDVEAVPIGAYAPGGRPQYGVRWVGGMFLGWLLLFGGLAAIWYLRPDLIDHWYKKVPASPNARRSTDFIIRQARADMDQKKYDDAYEKLKKQTSDNEDTAQLLASLRGQALWGKYLQAQEKDGKMPLKEDEDVVGALKDLDSAKNTMFADMIRKTIDADKVPELEKQAKTAAAAHAASARSLKFLAVALEDHKIIADKTKPIDMDEVVKALKNLTDDKQNLEAVNNLLAKAGVKDAGEKGVEALIAAWQDYAAKLADVNKALADARINGEGETGVKELIEARTKLETDRDGLDAVLKEAFKQMADAGAIAPEADPRKDLNKALKEALAKFENPLAQPLGSLASSVTDLGSSTAYFLKMGLENAGLLAELKLYELREPFVNSPKERLDTHLALMKNRRRQNASEVDAARKDALWLLSDDAQSSTDVKIKAHFLIALIDRNDQKFDEARKSLEDAIKEADKVKVLDPKNNDPIMKQVRQTQRELTDPAGWYLPTVASLQAVGHWNAALDELNVALLALPQDPRLSARRAVVQLEATRADPAYVAGKIPEKIQGAVRTDADVAVKDGGAAASEGAYALGLLEEELGNPFRAEQQYRAALKLSKGSADELNRIRIALARVLQRDRTPADIPANPPESRRRDTDGPRSTQRRDFRSLQDFGSLTTAHPFSLMVASLVVGQPIFDDDVDPAEAARLKESIEIAKELMASKDSKVKGRGSMLLGSALAKQGRRTEGLRLYIEGLKLVYPGKDMADLLKMVEEHPIFQQPDVTTRPNQYLAEYHYAQGRQFYFDRDYDRAEAHLKQAVTYFDKDARYWYFLGLAQVAHCTRIKRDAADLSFIRAGKLEAQNMPHPSVVDISLERIQGPLRQALDRYRVGGINTIN